MYKLSPRGLVGLAAVGLTVLTWGCSRPADSTSSAPANASSGVSRGNSVSSTASGKTEVNLSMPDSGRVTLVNSEVLRGKISIDAGRQVTVKAGSSAKSIPFNQLGRVTPDKDAPVYSSKGDIVIRGNDPQSTPVTNKIKVSWADFAIANPVGGQIQVMLPTKGNEGLISVAQDNQYVVEEIVFDPQQQKMIIQVRAY